MFLASAAMTAIAAIAAIGQLARVKSAWFSILFVLIIIIGIPVCVLVYYWAKEEIIETMKMIKRWKKKRRKMRL